MQTLARGAWSGLIATAQMTQFLFWGFRRLPLRERAPLPPALLSHEAGRKAGRPTPPPEEREKNTLLSHFLFGLSCSTLYSAIQSSRKRQAHPALEGAAYGLFVWSGSYLFGIPALGFRTSAYRMTAARNGLMVAAHIIWGMSLGQSEHELREKSGALLDGEKARAA